jgi:hypothetical protein
VRAIREAPGLVVLGPEAIPKLEDLPVERRTADLAILSLEAHRGGPDALARALAAVETVGRLQREASVVYYDMVLELLDASTRRALEDLMEVGQYVFRSDFARKYLGKGREAGLLEVAAKLLARGTPLAEIAEITGLSEAQITELRDTPRPCEP